MAWHSRSLRVVLDKAVAEDWLQNLGWSYTGGAEGASLQLGTFVATLVYCLLILRTIRRADEVAFVPHLSVSIGVLLAMVSTGDIAFNQIRQSAVSKRVPAKARPLMNSAIRSGLMADGTRAPCLPTGLLVYASAGSRPGESFVPIVAIRGRRTVRCRTVERVCAVVQTNSPELSE